MGIHQFVIFNLDTVTARVLSGLEHDDEIGRHDPHHAGQRPPVNLEESLRCEGSFTFYIINKIHERLLSRLIFC